MPLPSTGGRSKGVLFPDAVVAEEDRLGRSMPGSLQEWGKDGAFHAFHPGSRLRYFELLCRQ